MNPEPDDALTPDPDDALTPDPELAEPARQVAADRAELARTVEALADKANVPARSKRWLTDVGGRARSTLRGRGAAVGLVVSAALAIVLRVVRFRRR